MSDPLYLSKSVFGGALTKQCISQYHRSAINLCTLAAEPEYEELDTQSDYSNDSEAVESVKSLITDIEQE